MSTAIVVGAGPNGLAAAVTLARRGVRVTVVESAGTIGGGTRSEELTVPGLTHDRCSAVHPLGVASPFLRGLDLERHGLVWRHPEVDLAHPLDGGRAAAMTRSLPDTVARLGEDGPAWRRLFGPLAGDFDKLLAEVLRPLPHLPRHPLPLARFGVRALQPAALLARRWRSVEARALFGGVAAHGFHPLHRPTTAAVGLMLIAAGHRYGWPVAAGGSQAIARALAADLAEHGGTVETGVTVRSLADLPPSDAVLLDLAPGAVAALAGDRLPPRVRRAYRRYRHGPGAFKLDLAVEGGIPWADPHSLRAGTVHLGGTLEEMAQAERDINRGRMPERPFVLVAQQYLADPARSRGDVHPVYSYAHVPHGYSGDATEHVLRQFERFAPGTRERVVATACTRADAWSRYNANYVGGDIATGAGTARQLVLRPRIAPDPYRTGIPGVFLCSAATPPGAGVHGMCGHNAARSALRFLTAK
ncbi:FAD-dependent oxidoreductase [Actinomadura craniellae]|uniref:FAD-dependent oxidoreductase n=1 Tax=Actinomadura craniellae TaxID=2231787 RepID=A0A365HAJ4_9ACTN|nr:NAD(P)/FAD-dependent oxidoreductase [Actinomadura craniellae]RAY16117.1 FAD-dependent oxidoreductase [Actinomadura craniellae]